MTTELDALQNTMTLSDLQGIADQFVAARQSATPLAEFPGSIPPDLTTAYSIQDLAIEEWPDSIGGWKVGRIPVQIEDQFGIDRLAGPIFSRTIHTEGQDTTRSMPVFAGGFAAVEAEYVAVIGHDAPPDKLEWTPDEAAEIIGDLHIGLEIASSPLATINELGPPVVVSDFGNNAGLIVGPSIRDWRSRSLESMKCETFVDEHSVGTGGAFTLTGGFIRSVQFILELAASRGRPLQTGSMIATGQTNGIHDVLPAQNARISFGADGEITCDIVAATRSS